MVACTWLSIAFSSQRCQKKTLVVANHAAAIACLCLQQASHQKGMLVGPSRVQPPVPTQLVARPRARQQRCSPAATASRCARPAQVLVPVSTGRMGGWERSLHVSDSEGSCKSHKPSAEAPGHITYLPSSDTSIIHALPLSAITAPPPVHAAPTHAFASTCCCLCNVQRLEAHFNTGRRQATGTLRMDDHRDVLGGVRASAAVANEVRASTRKEASARTAGKDKADRATVEQAIDPRTRMVRREASAGSAGG